MTPWRLAVCAMAGALVLATTAHAQDYPSRTVTIVNPFAPGGGVDQMARLMAAKLEQRLGKNFVVV